MCGPGSRSLKAGQTCDSLNRARSGIWRFPRAAPSRPPRSPTARPPPTAHIPSDPPEPAFDDDHFVARLRNRRTGIKRALLDQSLISGVGNIYADEALWRARLDWGRGTDALRRPEVSRLVDAIREVFGAALLAGGTTFDGLYVHVN